LLTPKRRLGWAVAAVLLGVAFCFAMYGWQSRYEYALDNPVGNLLIALPFVALAGLIVCGMGRTAATLGWVVLAALTGFAYVAAATSTSSTAVLVFLVPFFWGGIAVAVIFAVDQVIRSRHSRHGVEPL
jgi:hypothetical protein